MNNPGPYTETALDTRCHHCGDRCEGEPIRFDERDFCCVGCRNVYQILTENGLDTYYSLEAQPGSSPEAEATEDRFAGLDHPQIRLKLLDYEDETQAHVTFSLPQIHCTACVWLLENLHRIHPGVRSGRVDFVRRETALVFDPTQLSLRELAELLARIGYAPDLRLEQLDDKPKERPDRRLIYQLGVAGFCFGNIMLMSFPEYLGLAEIEFMRLFGALNLLLSLPVVFYSAQDYFRSAWYSLRAGLPNIDVPVSLGIASLFGRSVYEIAVLGEAGYLDSLAGLVFFLLIGKWFQQKTYRRLSFDRAFASYFPVSAVRETPDGVEHVPLDELAEGDVVQVRNRELIPADAVLLSDRADVDYSFVTGESEPVHRKTGELLYAGGRQTGATIRLALAKEVSHSYLTKLWEQDAFHDNPQRSLQTVVDRVSRYFTLAILLVGFIAGAYWWYVAGAGAAVNVFTAVLIVACPCALALTMPFTLGNGTRLLGKFGLFLKQSDVIERLANVKTLVFDKTGTLTTGVAQTNWVGETLTAEEKNWAAALAYHSTHPLSRAVRLAAKSSRAADPRALPPIEAFSEVEGKGLSGKLNGHRLRLGSATWVGQNGNASAPGQVWFAVDGRVRGHWRVQGSLRPGLLGLLQRLRGTYRLALLSGDHPTAASSFRDLFPAETPLRFGQSPYDKLAFVREEQDNDRPVLVVGDGLNDAGALRQASVGIALSEDINSFSPACDGILDASRLSFLDQILAFARGCMRIVRIGFVLSVSYNLIGLGFAVQGLLAPVVAAILMPLSSISIIALAVIGTQWLGQKFA